MGLNRFKQQFFGSTWRGKLFKLFQQYKKPAKLYSEYLKTTGGHDFVDRSEGFDKLVYVMGGYQDYLWKDVFDRLRKNVPENFDVCILATGTDNERLRKIAKENEWSYLSTRGGRIGPDQNIVIEKHPNAEYIFKLDEDIFIGENYFESLLNAFKKAKEEARFDLGFIAPVLNINSFSYDYFLEYTGNRTDYEDKFGRVKKGVREGKINQDAAIAKYIWDKSLPLDEKIGDFSKNNEVFKPIFSRYTIGAIMYSRELWEEIGKFEPDVDDNLGGDEDQLIRECAIRGKIPVIATKVFAGHFSFGPQTEEMKQFWSENVRDLSN